MDSSTSGRVVLRFLDGDGDPAYLDADMIVGISVGLVDRRDPAGRLVRVRGTIVHTAAGPIPVDEDYGTVLRAWLEATDGAVRVADLDGVTSVQTVRPQQLTEPAPCE